MTFSNNITTSHFITDGLLLYIVFVSLSLKSNILERGTFKTNLKKYKIYKKIRKLFQFTHNLTLINIKILINRLFSDY